VAGRFVLGLIAALILDVLADVSGPLRIGKGYGWDGEYYVRMIEVGFKEGTPAMRLRPVVLLINAEVNRHLHNPRATFHAMNLVYAFTLAIALAALCQRYGCSAIATATLVLNLFLCISVAKMFAFYPTLVDLGAYAFLTIGICAIVWDRRVLIVLTSIVAVLSREFGAVAVLFGVVRDWRRGRSLLSIALTYAPAVIVFFWIRRFTAASSSTADVTDPTLSLTGVIAALLRNTEWWLDPIYVFLSLYFIVTLFGGVSIFVLTTPRRLVAGLREEPEWLAIVVPLLVMSALGRVDMWRYAAFMIPAIPAFWAWAVSSIDPRRRWLLFLAVSIATVATQRPWQHMNDDLYFRDWFPYFLARDHHYAGMWAAWRVYIAVAGASVAGLAAVRVWAGNTRQPGMSSLPPIVE
jgi:hypothetical protein